MEARRRASTTLRRLDAVLADLIDAETGQRGYLLTGVPAYLEPHLAARVRLAADTVELRSLAAGDSALSAALDRLGPLIGARLAALDRAVGAFARGGQEAARRSVLSDSGKEIMDRIRAELAAVRAEWEGTLALRSSRAAAFAAAARRVIVVGEVVAVALFAGSALLIWRQLSALRQAHRAIAEREHELAQILETLPVGIFIVDSEGRPHYANRLSGAILGRSAEPDAGDLARAYQVYRAGTRELYPSDQLPVLRALRGETVHVTDIEIRRPDRSVPVEVWAAPVYGDGGRIVLAVAAFSDVTEQEEARRRIEELNRELARRVGELEALNRELETFSYSASHDLRAPLRAVDGFARMLIEDHGAELSAEARRRLEVIRERTQRMGRLLDDLLRLSRVTRKELEPARVEMRLLVQGVIADLTEGLRNRPEILIGELPEAWGDVALLRQVWSNLLANALKYSATRPEPSIEIGGTVQAGERIYHVRDNGVGFDMAYAGKLFGVFQRLHRPEEFDGTGVGLAIVQRIVHRHGGRVWAEAAPERGATFFFALPDRGTP